MKSRVGTSKNVTSVGTSMQLFTGGIVAAALILTLGIGYITTVEAMRKESLRALQLLIESRAEGESGQFLRAEDNVLRLKGQLLDALPGVGYAHAEREFHRLFRRCDDGLWRVRPEFDDFAHLPTLYLQHDVELTPSIYQRAVASYQLLANRGPALVPPYYSVYMDFVECGLMVYSPHVDWGGNATRETDNHNYPTMVGSIPSNNPNREKFWTPVYFDEEAAVWMVSVIEPLDWMGEWVGTVGHDVAINALMETTLRTSLEGTYNIMMSREGQLIVHPEFTERIRAAKGDLSLDTLNDPVLNQLAGLIAGSDEFPAVLTARGNKNWYGVATIAGPEWYLITVYPKALVAHRVLRALALPISVGLIILLTTLLFVALVVRRTILRPLQFMDDAMSTLSEGNDVTTIPITSDDEFGRLARSFETLSARLIARERSLEESRRDWERTFDTVPEMIAILDCDSRVRQVNRTFLDRHGLLPDQCLTQFRVALLPDEDRIPLVEALDRLNTSGTAQHFKHHCPTLCSTLDTTLAPMFNESGEMVGTVEVSRDISEQTKLEEQLRHAQKMDAVGQLAGGVAHDFNNLLQVILGYSEGLLLDLNSEDMGYQELVEVQKAADRAAALTRQLLAFSRRQVIVTRSQDLNDIVHGAVKMIQRLIGEHIELYCIPAPEPVRADVDHNQIEQVVMNLCINARDAMPDGGMLTIELKYVLLDSDAAASREWLKPGRYVQLVVTDTGIGMDPEVRKRIFEPFYTTKDKHKGTGLGLATVYGIVRQHDGEIEVYSEANKGTTFRIFLPAVAEEEPEEAVVTDTEVRGGSECILVAEDDAQIQRLIEKVLVAEGYTVLLAGDGAEAISLYEAHESEVDLLILDVIMPKANGKVVLEAIQRRRPDIPCLFASGYSENALHLNFKLQKGLHLIEKPYQRAVLLRKVREILDNGSA